MDTNAGFPLESKHDFYVKNEKKKVPLGSWKGEFTSSVQ